MNQIKEGVQNITQKIRDWVITVPFVTIVLFLIMILVFILQNLNIVNIGLFCFSSIRLWRNLNYVYTILTSSYLHGNLLHIAFNMSALISFGHSIERKKGSLLFLHKTLIYAIGHNILQLPLFYLMSYNKTLVKYTYSCSIGFSGVLFGLLGYQCYDQGNRDENRNLFFFNISLPIRLYPWILLIVLQILIPNVSLFGHLSGLIIGIMDSFNLLSFLEPSGSILSYIESKIPLHKISSYVSYSESNGYILGFGEEVGNV